MLFAVSARTKASAIDTPITTCGQTVRLWDMATGRRRVFWAAVPSLASFVSDHWPGELHAPGDSPR